MTPPARTQAAIELLDGILLAAREGGAAADTLIARYFAARRYAGSKDRRAVRELVYAAIRMAGEMPPSGRAAMMLLADTDEVLATTFDASAHGPTKMIRGEPRAQPGVAPAWLVKALAASGLPAKAMPALVGRAPLDCRVNTLIATRDDVLAVLPDAVATPIALAGIRLPAGTNVEQLPLFAGGAIEVQDEGSQLVALAAAAEPGQLIVDLCAGAGGKTLALAAAMANQGRIVACDTDRGRLQRLAPRADRAGVTIVESRLLDPGEEASTLADLRGQVDTVLVDAPCSGTGTWRRNPEARWRLNQPRLTRLQATQAHILDTAARLVKPGGAITYIVCSLLDAEGPAQVTAFLSRFPGWTAIMPELGAGRPRGAGLRLDPASDGTDGFFVARLVAP
jgi:16S rRNA (cytosine967-C5)-methyltransferase